MQFSEFSNVLYRLHIKRRSWYWIPKDKNKFLCECIFNIFNINDLLIKLINLWYNIIYWNINMIWAEWYHESISQIDSDIKGLNRSAKFGRCHKRKLINLLWSKRQSILNSVYAPCGWLISSWGCDTIQLSANRCWLRMSWLKWEYLNNVEIAVESNHGIQAASSPVV